MELIRHLLRLLSTIAVIGYVSTATTCSDGWLAFQGSCYLFGHYPVHFIEASSYCRLHNAHLVEIEDAVENAFLKDRLRERNQPYYWLGITDEAVEGIWRWFHDNEIATFTDWGPTEPQPERDEDCAVMEIQYDYAWADVKCTRECLPLCERSE